MSPTGRARRKSGAFLSTVRATLRVSVRADQVLRSHSHSRYVGYEFVAPLPFPSNNVRILITGSDSLRNRLFGNMK